MTNNQRMVDVGLLRRLAGICASHRYSTTESKLHAIIDGPGVEPVGMFVRKGLDNYPSLEWQKNYVAKDGDKLYLAAPQPPKEIGE